MIFHIFINLIYNKNVSSKLDKKLKKLPYPYIEKWQRMEQEMFIYSILKAGIKKIQQNCIQIF